MTTSVTLSIAWVLAATAVAMLPMRKQYVPGVILLLAAPVLIVFLALQHGWIAGLAALMALVSMFRNPLRYFWRRWRGLASTINSKEPR